MLVEIKGVKLEIDEQYAKTIEQYHMGYHIGDNVKVLVKEYSTYKSYPGIIAGFDAFQELPTIIVAYVKNEYRTPSVEFVYINSESKEVEICPMVLDEIPFIRENIESIFDEEIKRREQEVVEMKTKKQYFMQAYNKHFTTKEGE